MNEIPAVKGWFLGIVSDVVSAGKNAAEQAAQATEGTGEMFAAAYEKVGTVGVNLKNNIQSQLVKQPISCEVPSRKLNITSVNESDSMSEIISEFPFPPSHHKDPKLNSNSNFANLPVEELLQNDIDIEAE